MQVFGEKLIMTDRHESEMVPLVSFKYGTLKTFEIPKYINSLNSKSTPSPNHVSLVLFYS